jgi:hypothetical protein
MSKDLHDACLGSAKLEEELAVLLTDEGSLANRATGAVKVSRRLPESHSSELDVGAPVKNSVCCGMVEVDNDGKPN